MASAASKDIKSVPTGTTGTSTTATTSLDVQALIRQLTETEVVSPECKRDVIACLKSYSQPHVPGSAKVLHATTQPSEPELDADPGHIRFKLRQEKFNTWLAKLSDADYVLHHHEWVLFFDGDVAPSDGRFYKCEIDAQRHPYPKRTVGRPFIDYIVRRVVRDCPCCRGMF